MKNNTKWYDPICYQFSFYFLRKKTESFDPVEIAKPFWEELTPYFHLWMDLQGRVIVQSTSSDGTLVNSAKNHESFCDSWNILERRSGMLNSYEIALVPDKTRSRFAVSAKTLSKELRQEVLRYIDIEEFATLNASQRAERLCEILNCPTEDLAGLYFPQGFFETKGIPLKIYFSRFDYPNPLLSRMCESEETSAFANDQTSNDEMNLYYIHISLPRCMINYANRTFDLQHKWEKRMLLLCDTFESSFGFIKMDRYKTESVFPLFTGNGWFIPKFEMGIPDVAWGICLERHQAEGLNFFSNEHHFSLFDKILRLENGHLYLRLTPDVSIIPKSKVKELWRLFFPQLCISDYSINNIRDVPVSFRLGIDSENLQVNENGYYRIIR